MKVNQDGDSLWTTYLELEDNYLNANDILISDDGGYLAVGCIYSFNENDICLARWDNAEGIIDEKIPPYPSSIILYPPYPNPFNSSLDISYQLPAASLVELKVYDISGREVASIVNGQRSMGEYEVVWNAEGMPSGIYFVELIVDGRWSMAQKVVLVR
jgi:hypothetical protein